MAVLNYAKQYSQALANAYPYTLNFGRLWNTENASKYRVTGANTIEIPTLSTGGRTDGDKTKIGDFTQNFANGWEPKVLGNHRTWQTLVHPKDIVETNMVASISNITQTMNETEKFPEMDAYLISKLYGLKNALEPVTQETVALTATNVLAKFDKLMEEMDESLVPANGRILYVDTFTKTLFKNAVGIVRANGDKALNREPFRVINVLPKGKHTLKGVRKHMKNQTIGIEIEMTGITRARAAEVVATFLQGTIQRTNDSYYTYKITATDGRVWKIMSDASIQTMKKEEGKLISSGRNYSVELVSPILAYTDIENLQEIVRQLRHAGAVSDSKYKCGIHIHIGAKNHTPQTLKNLVNLMASKEDLIYKSLEIDPARIRYCQKVNAEIIETINKEKPKTMQALADLWYSGYHEDRNRH